MTEEAKKVEDGGKTALLVRFALTVFSFLKEFLAIFMSMLIQHHKVRAARAENELAKLKTEVKIDEEVSKIEASRAKDPRDGIDNFLRKQ